MSRSQILRMTAALLDYAAPSMFSISTEIKTQIESTLVNHGLLIAVCQYIPDQNSARYKDLIQSLIQKNPALVPTASEIGMAIIERCFAVAKTGIEPVIRMRSLAQEITDLFGISPDFSTAKSKVLEFIRSQIQEPVAKGQFNINPPNPRTLSGKRNFCGDRASF